MADQQPAPSAPKPEPPKEVPKPAVAPTPAAVSVKPAEPSPPFKDDKPSPPPDDTEKSGDKKSWWQRRKERIRKGSKTQTTFSKDGVTTNEQHESLESILKVCQTDSVQHNALITDMIKWVATRAFKYLMIVAIITGLVAIAPSLGSILGEMMAIMEKYGLI